MKRCCAKERKIENFMHITEKPDGIAYFWTLTNSHCARIFPFLTFESINKRIVRVQTQPKWKTQCLRFDKITFKNPTLLSPHWTFHSTHPWFSLKMRCGWLVKPLKCTGHGKGGETLLAACANHAIRRKTTTRPCRARSHQRCDVLNRLYLRVRTQRNENG